MNDIEKVVNGLTEVRQNIDCASGSKKVRLMDIVDEAIKLLKEQEAVVPINSYGTFRCGNCRNIVGYNDGHWHGYQNNFCSKCGKAVNWDESDDNA